MNVPNRVSKYVKPKLIEVQETDISYHTLGCFNISLSKTDRIIRPQIRKKKKKIENLNNNFHYLDLISITDYYSQHEKTHSLQVYTNYFPK